MGLTASLKDDPTFKRRLQEGLRGHVARLVREVREFSSEVVDFVREKTQDPDKKVVLIVDSVEQIRGVGSDANSVYKSVENLFVGHSDSLGIPKLHVVYTIPPYLIPLAPNLGRVFGGNAVCNLPSVHVKNRDNTPDKQGLAVMRSLVNRRHPNWKATFTQNQLDRLAQNAGGDIRDFFRLIKECLIQASSAPLDSQQVSQHIIDNAESQLRREMLPVPREDAQWLQRIASSKQAELNTIQQLPELARFFDTHVVINYRNDDDWYDIHPLLEGFLEP